MINKVILIGNLGADPGSLYPEWRPCGHLPGGDHGALEGPGRADARTDRMAQYSRLETFG